MFHGDKRGQRRHTEQEKKAQDRADKAKQEQRDARARMDQAQKTTDKDDKAVNDQKERKDKNENDYRYNNTDGVKWPSEPISLTKIQEKKYHELIVPVHRFLQFLHDS